MDDQSRSTAAACALVVAAAGAINSVGVGGRDAAVVLVAAIMAGVVVARQPRQ